MRQKDVVVCFPFKKEDVDVFSKNIKEALSNKRVKEVILVAYSKNETYQGIENFINTLSKEDKERVHLVLQKRFGTKRREGKGDGMNTAIQYFLEHTDGNFLHFYDADIKSFSSSWIDRVQRRLDEGYDVARCFYPRSYTDAQVTWNITRTGFAYVWPDTILPDIEQPLGGELGFNRHIAEKLSKDNIVLSASDWSIDTAFTISFARYNVKLYEVYIEEGKEHKLYGRLSDLKTMAIECFDFIKDNKDLVISTDKMVYHKDELKDIPEKYKHMVAFDIKGSKNEFKVGWTPKMKEYLVRYFPREIGEKVNNVLTGKDTEFIDIDLWFESYGVFMKYFDISDKDWRELFFKLWVLRVLNHAKLAIKYPDKAIKHLRTMLTLFRERRMAKRL